MYQGQERFTYNAEECPTGVCQRNGLECGLGGGMSVAMEMRTRAGCGPSGLVGCKWLARDGGLSRQNEPYSARTRGGYSRVVRSDSEMWRIRYHQRTRTSVRGCRSRRRDEDEDADSPLQDACLALLNITGYVTNPA